MQGSWGTELIAQNLSLLCQGISPNLRAEMCQFSLILTIKYCVLFGSVPYMPKTTTTFQSQPHTKHRGTWACL